MFDQLIDLIIGHLHICWAPFCLCSRSSQGSQAGELITVCLKTWGVLGEAGNGVGRAWDQVRCHGLSEVWAGSPTVSSAGSGSKQDSNTRWMTKWMKMEIFPKKSKTVSSSVTESKLVLLTSWQANKLRDELFGQGVVALLRKLADWEEDGLLSQEPSCLS